MRRYSLVTTLALLVGCDPVALPIGDAAAVDSAVRSPDAARDAGGRADASSARDAGEDPSSDASGLPDGGRCEARPSGALTRYAGNPLLRNGPEAYDLGKAGPRVVLREGGLYRLFYEAVDGLVPWQVTDLGYATSADGRTWTKMGTVFSAASAWEGNEVSPDTLLFEEGVYKLWYHAGGNALPHRNIGYATSADGLSWTRHPTPVLSVGGAGSFDEDEVAEARVIRVGAGYRMYYTGANDAGKSLGMASSTDGIVWTKSIDNPILSSARWGNYWGGAFFYEDGTWHLWHGVEGSRGLHYMWSANGLEWIDGPSNPVLTVSGDPNAADYGLVGDSVSGYRDGATYRILYTGYNGNLFGSLGRFEGICMAEIASPCAP